MIIGVISLLVMSFTVPSAYAQDSQVSTVGYGLVTSKIKKNITTQEDLIVLLGAPNITTTDAEGSETWVYDKVSTETVQQGKITGEGAQSGRTDASAKGEEFGVNILVAGYKKGNEHVSGTSSAQSKVSAQDEVKRSTTTKNFTLIIKFNDNKTVKTYTVRQASF